MKIRLTKLKRNKEKTIRQIVALSVVILITIAGTYLLTSSHAATPYSSAGAINGSLSNGATSGSCTGTTATNCVTFSGQVAASCTVKESTVANAQSALSTAANGSVICMNPGIYNAINISGAHSAKVTFETDPSLNPNTTGKVTFDGITIASSNLYVHNFYSTSGVSFVDGSNYSTIDHSDVTDVPGGNGIGIYCSINCSNIAITGNRIHDLSNTDGTNPPTCSTYGGDGDAIRLDGFSQTTVTGNEETRIKEISGGSICEGHEDCLQTLNWDSSSKPITLPALAPPLQQLIFSNNYIHDNNCEGPPFIKDSDIPSVTISDNLNVRNAWSAVGGVWVDENTTNNADGPGGSTVGGTSGLTITKNTYQGTGGSIVTAGGSLSNPTLNVNHNVFDTFRVSNPGYAINPAEDYDIFTDPSHNFGSGTAMGGGTIGPHDAFNSSPALKCGASCGVGNDDYELVTNTNNIGIDWNPSSQIYGPN